jgi:hypothetical protein
MGWSAKPRKVRLSELNPNHVPEGFLGRKMDPRYANQPIWLKPGLFRKWRIHDGNYRVILAKRSGKTHIWAYVWE